MIEKKQPFQEYLKTITQEFEYLPTQRDKLEALVEYGRDLEDFSPIDKKDEHKVPGCVSEVFIIAELDSEGKMQFKACSQSHIVKGYLVILLTALNGMTPQEVLDSEPVIKEFVEKTGMSQSLIASRANAFGNIFVFMQKKAQALMN